MQKFTILKIKITIIKTNLKNILFVVLNSIEFILPKSLLFTKNLTMEDTRLKLKIK